jgi:hypothetical protein
MESAGNAMNIMMLDACRDNPFARSFRSSTRGLVQIDAPQGSLIVYATSPGKTAADGEGRNGIFTKHLLKMISVMNLEIRQLIQEVRKAVVDETNGNQTPWESSSLMDNFYFTILPPKPPDISIVDITSIKKAKEKRESIKSGWESWQARMKSDFMEIEKVDKSPAYTREEKESAWRKFLESYKADNPFSTADEQLRQRVTQRIKGLLKRIHDKVESQKLEVGKIVPLSEVDNPPILIKKVAPKYHRSSIISFDYKIKVRILITEDGEVENAVIIRHAIPHNIRSAVIKAIKEWKYTPALKNGVKVKVWKVVNIRLERK